MQFDYLEIKERLRKGAKYLEGKWGQEGFDDAKDLYNTLAIQSLEYEIENDLLPI